VLEGSNRQYPPKLSTTPETLTVTRSALWCPNKGANSAEELAYLLQAVEQLLIKLLGIRHGAITEGDHFVASAFVL
jgi:hypothetical protein